MGDENKWSSQILTKFILHTEKKNYTAGNMNLKNREGKTDSSSFLTEEKKIYDKNKL